MRKWGVGASILGRRNSKGQGPEQLQWLDCRVGRSRIEETRVELNWCRKGLICVGPRL